jgi:hypothetical protein
VSYQSGGFFNHTDVININSQAQTDSTATPFTQVAGLPITKGTPVSITQTVTFAGTTLNANVQMTLIYATLPL